MERLGVCWNCTEGLGGCIGVEELAESFDFAVLQGNQMDEIGFVFLAGRANAALRAADNGDGIRVGQEVLGLKGENLLGLVAQAHPFKKP